MITETSMTYIAQYARFAAREGLAGKVRAALEEAAAAAVQEPGTLLYLIHDSQSEPDTIWMYELYASPDAQAAHSGSEATARLRAAVADLLAEPLTVTRGSALNSLGLPHP
jgi:quinol monooxygenase YgiN